MIHTKTPQAILGLDLGQSEDPSTMALILNIDQTISPHNWIDSTHPRHNTWQLTATKVFPLGTAYTALAQQIHHTLERFKQQHPTTPITLLADATGIGRPTLEILHKELTSKGGQPKARLEGIVFTAGATHSKTTHPSLPIDLFHVPKLDPISTLLQSIECHQLKVIPNLPEQQTLVAQLKSLRYANSRQTGQTTIQVDSNASDPQIANADLVMALAMATWRMKCLYPNPNPNPPQRLPGF